MKVLFKNHHTLASTWEAEDHALFPPQSEVYQCLLSLSAIKMVSKSYSVLSAYAQQNRPNFIQNRMYDM